MSLLELVETAFESLTTNKMRTFLTMLGVIIGVAAVVTLLALGSGVQASIDSQISSQGVNLLNVSPNRRVSGARLTLDDANALADRLNVPDAVLVVPQLNGNATVSAGINKDTPEIIGTTPDYFPVKNVALSAGVAFTQSDVDQRLRVAVIGPTLAQNLFGAQPALGQTFLIGSVPFKVIGVLQAKGGTGFGGTDDSAFVPLTVAMEKLFVNRAAGLKSISSITVEAASTGQSTAALNEIAAVLRKRHGIIVGQPDDFSIFDQASLVATLNTVVGTLTAFLGAIGAISLLVGGIGIMNIMLVSVTERTREIGVRKAIGAQPAAIHLQFLIEALAVTMVAGVLGIVLSVILVTVINSVQTSVSPVIEPTSVLIAFTVSVLIGVLFGFYPAWRAARLEPVEALRYE
ncbi:MAG: ABC transporter permease [Chloroflexi bacterium]|nr:ABC transporter permease [Chloroflexota bacterium]MCL5275406.1 ABC transporter permease [Chloroflexota bacterium]